MLIGKIKRLLMLNHIDNNNKRGSNYDELIQKLSQYGDDYYPSNFAFTVIPESEDQLRVIIMGQRANHDNFILDNGNQII